MGKGYEALIDKSIELGALEARLVPAKEIVFDDRSFLKCRFGCNRWGKYWTCPPNLELTPDPCRYPHLARPSMDGYGVDIGKTLEPLGFKVEFDKKGEFLPVWYVMVLLD
jgi:predicted metal-binding protein